MDKATILLQHSTRALWKGTFPLEGYLFRQVWDFDCSINSDVLITNFFSEALSILLLLEVRTSVLLDWNVKHVFMIYGQLTVLMKATINSYNSHECQM
ncbi:hypothetical protein MTR67_020990, partial [Solanum verrucosum]